MSSDKIKLSSSCIKALKDRAKLIASLRKNSSEKTLDFIYKSLLNEEIRKIKKITSVAARKPQKKNAKVIKKKSEVVVKKVKIKTKLEQILEENSDWSGYSDDEGSVDSGVLDENVCFECGKKTHREQEWETLILCDMCDAEYHLECIGLDLHPRRNYTCHRCLEDEFNYDNLKFTVDPKFEIPKLKRGEEKPGICYSPCRPLNEAWKECKKKGFMVVSRVLPYEVMRKLTHGMIEKKTQSGRIAETWLGATEEIAKQSKQLTNKIINRGGRYDIKLPDYVVEECELEKHLQPILKKLKTIMGTPLPKIRTHNVVFVPVGCPPQAWHCDDTITEGKVHRYFTILIHLNPIDCKGGGTEIWVKKLKRGDMIRGRPGDAFVFNGSLWHRGYANEGRKHRFFYYASFACRADTNTGEIV